MGYELQKTDRPIPIYSARDANILGFYLKPVVSSGRKLRIIQVGANDGIIEDPLVPFLSSSNVEAVLVEPLPDVGEALRRMYSDSPHVHVEIVGISDQSETIEFFVALRAEDDKIADSRISSFDRSHVERHIRNRKSIEPAIFGANPRVEKMMVECCTVAQIMERMGWAEADILVIDAEGLDFAIVNNTLSGGNTFGMIYFEHLNMSAVEYQVLSGKFDEAGYALVISGKDTLAVGPGFLAPA